MPTQTKVPPVLDVDGRTYRTPLTDVPATTYGTARLAKVRQHRAYYHAEGTYGHRFLRITGGSALTTRLQRLQDGEWATWMTDDWLHWHAMRERVLALPQGVRTLVCAGLGLGLMLHHIHEERADIEDVRVVEIDPDVIGLMSPHLPDDPRFSVWQGDFWRYLADEEEPDAVLWDLAVGESHETRAPIIKAMSLVPLNWPKAHLSIFGVRLER